MAYGCCHCFPMTQQGPTLRISCPSPTLAHRLRMLTVQGEFPGRPPTIRPFSWRRSSLLPHSAKTILSADMGRMRTAHGGQGRQQTQQELPKDSPSQSQVLGNLGLFPVPRGRWGHLEALWPLLLGTIP